MGYQNILHPVKWDAHSLSKFTHFYSSIDYHYIVLFSYDFPSGNAIRTTRTMFIKNSCTASFQLCNILWLITPVQKNTGWGVSSVFFGVGMIIAFVTPKTLNRSIDIWLFQWGVLSDLEFAAGHNYWTKYPLRRFQWCSNCTFVSHNWTRQPISTDC